MPVLRKASSGGELTPGCLTVCAFIVFTCLLFFGGGQVCAETLVFVRWVDDGDTIVLGDGRRIRYIGMNAPEVGREGIDAEPFGPEAKTFNRRMVFQKHVRLEFDQERADQYGRSLAYVFDQAGTFVNRELLLGGYGHCLFRRPNLKYQNVLLEAQRLALKTAKGIWHNWTPRQGRFVGHKQSRRFHLDTCPLAQSISPQNRVYFTKMRDALWQGYAPAKNCLPAGIF